ncbi:MAG: response regulator [Planctomycetes bacterium]|nr:response regulator [Planctomycetota bacterium]MBI3834523.1 response regulator [Planctomycetota bacterium]
MPEQDHGTILVIEDESELRFILNAHLRAMGFKVLEAGDGPTGLRVASNELPDVIIMDIGLPVMDGIQLTHALKRQASTAPIPIIMLTARSSSQDVVRGLDAGAQEYLFKPFDVSELLARVRTVHRLASARRDLDQLNTRLEAEVELKTRRLRFLYEFMRDLNRAHEKDEILDLLIRCVEQTIGAKRISLFLADTSGDQLICERAVGIENKPAQQFQIKQVEGVTGQVFRTGKTYSGRAYGSGIASDERSYERDTFVSTPLVSTSLKTQEGIIGVLNVTDRGDDVPFADDEVDCIRSIADAAAIALDNMRRRMRLQQSVQVLLNTVGRLAEYRDEETTKHIERVSKLSRVLAKVLRNSEYSDRINDEFVDNLVQASPLHDIGKVGIPDDILTKPGKLTDEEYNIMKTHTDIGRRVLSEALDPAHPVPLLRMCIDIAYCHHERWDGKGYPRRIKGEQIPLAARIVTLVDAYDAITSHRRYKAAKSHAAAVEIIQSESGAHFDPVIVRAFLNCESEFDAVRGRFADAAEYVAAV